MAGFYSKDLILEVACTKHDGLGYFSYFIGTISAFFTALYSTRLVYLIFIVKPSGYRQIITGAFDSGFQISFALACLAIPSVFIGYYLKDMVVGFGSQFFAKTVFTNLDHLHIMDSEFVVIFNKLLPVLLSIIGVVFAFLFLKFQSKFLFKLKFSYLGKRIYSFLNRKWFFDKIYNEYLGQFFFKYSYSVSYKFVDRGVFEILGPTGFSFLGLSIGNGLHKMQSGFIYHYTIIILICITFLLELKQLWVAFGWFLDYRLFILIFILLFCFKSFENSFIFAKNR